MAWVSRDRPDPWRNLSSEVEKLPLGIFFLNPKSTFEEKLSVYQESKDPLYKRSPDLKKLSEWIQSKRGS
jgi:hypothetical protein